MRLMIASKFWSRSTYLKPYPRLIGHLIGDSVLYHSLYQRALKAGKKTNKEFGERWEYTDLFYQETVFGPKSIGVATQV
jgi:hypothetical protein